MNSGIVQPDINYPLGYNPSLDGLRALSVSAVVLLHARVPGFSWGGVGVDVFFVISGFLITSGLLAEYRRDGEISIMGFYRRRALRLFPAIISVCIALIAFSATSPLLAFHALAEVLAAVLYIGNWVRAFHPGSLVYLGHTWSLAIEEQYYLFWPLVIIGVLRWARNQILPIILALVLLVVAWRSELLFLGASEERLYNGTDTRIDALLVGSALAVISQMHELKTVLTRVGLWCWFPAGVAIVFCSAVRTNVPGYLPTNTVVAIAAAVLIIATNAAGLLQSILGNPILVWVGRRSYGIYLWHYLILMIALLTFQTPMAVAGSLSIMGGLVCAAASYYWIEQPFLRIRYSNVVVRGSVTFKKVGT